MSGAARDYFNDWQREISREPLHTPHKRHTKETEMANINDLVQSKYLKASDLQGRRIKLVIDRVSVEAVGQNKEMKAVMYFAGKEKGMVLNKTNLFNAGNAFGAETDDWGGKEVIAYSVKVQNQNGQMVDGLRIDPVVPVVSGNDPDDSIPF